MTLTERYPTYLADLLRGNRTGCAQTVRDLLAAGVPVPTLYTDLFRASLYEIGELWQTNRISVATEHLATAITEMVMSLVVGPVLFGQERVGRSLVVSCVANEYHQIGGRMVADHAELHGWDTYFLGADVPLPDLLSLLDEKKPDLLALSLAFKENLPSLRASLTAVRRQQPDLPVWLGGQGLVANGATVAAEFPGMRCFAGLEPFTAALDEFARAPRAA